MSNLLFDTIERTSADEKNICRIDLNKLLVGVLASTLRRNIDRRTLQNLQQCLLHTLARHIARNRRIVALAGDLIHLINKHDTALGLLDIVVGHLQQSRQDTLDVLAYVARLGQHRSVHNRKRHIEQLSYRAGHQRFTRTRRTNQNDIRLIDLDVARLVRCRHQTLIVVINRHRHIAFRSVLTNHILIQESLDLSRLQELLHHGRIDALALALNVVVLVQNHVTLLDTLITYIRARATRKQQLYLRTRRTAERTAIFAVIRSVILSHFDYLFSRFESTSSIRP